MPDAPIQRDFIGLNRDKPPTNIAPNEASHCKNVVFNRQRVEKRKGSLRVSPYVIPEASMFFNGTTWAQSPSINNSVYQTFNYAHGTHHTLEASLRFPSGNSTNTHAIASRYDGTKGWSLWFYEPQKTFYYEETLNAGTDIGAYGTYTQYSPGKPFHIAVVRDAGDCRLYVNDGDFSGQIGKQTGLTATAGETSTTNPFPVCYGSSIDASGNYQAGVFRISEFRTWDHTLATDTIDAYALKELPAHAHATDSCKFYYKFNEGSGTKVYDYGFVSRLTTSTNLFALSGVPTAPEWVTGMVHGGAGDFAVRFDGRDDFFGFPTPNDELAAFRTGTSGWSVQAVVRPMDQIEDDAVFFMYGNATYTTGSGGFAFRLKAQVNAHDDKKFVGQFCFLTETAEIVYSQGFTNSCSYRVTMQRRQSEVAMRVSPQNASDGAWETAGIFHTSQGPGYLNGAYFVAGASVPVSGAIPTSNFANFDLEELRLWSSLRDEAMDQTYPNPHDNDLEAYYKFNDGSGNLVADSSSNRNRGYLFPDSDGPIWDGGFVEPVEGGKVTGLFFYQKNNNLLELNDTRNRGLLVCGANSIYRQEGGKWRELRGGRDADNLYSAAQLQEYLVICNGVDDNLVYDGESLYKCGVDAPTEPPTHTNLNIKNGDTWDSITVNWAGGVGSLVCVDSARTEGGFSWNNKRFIHYLGGSTGTIETRCDKYFKARSFSNLKASNFKTNSTYFFVYHNDWMKGRTFEVPIGGLEGATFEFWQHAYVTNNPGVTYQWQTATGKIVGDIAIPPSTQVPLPSSNHFGRIIQISSNSTWTFTDINGNYSGIFMTGHFIWDKVLNEKIYATTSYEINVYDAGVDGDFYYRYTNYNKYTDTESLPSPPCDQVVNAAGNAVQVTVPYTTNSNVTGRFLYRTKRSGAKDGQFYYKVDTIDSTGTYTFNDTILAGEEGVEISFYRDVPPKSSIVKAFKGRVWYVSVENPHLLYFSEIGRPCEVDPYNYLIFGDGNDYITGLGISYDNLVVFKRRSIWVVSRAEVATGIRPYRISDSVGCVSHHTIKEVNGEILFLAEDGLYSLMGSQLRRVSSDKVQYYFDRQDPSRRHVAVAGHLPGDGIYRLNFTPDSDYSGSSRSDVNSWYLDYHYQRSRDHVPFFEAVWGYGEREVSFYGEYVSEDHNLYQAYGDYRGGVYIDNVFGGYTDGLGWYRGASVANKFLGVDGDTAIAGAYTVTVDNTLYTGGDGLKGLPVLLKTATATETKIVYSNSASQVVFTEALTNDFQAGSSLLIAPIIAEYQGGWQDFGSPRSSKKSQALHIDYAYQTTGTLTVSVYGARSGLDDAVRTVVKGIRMTDYVDDIEFRTRAKHMKVDFYHDHPGETFELFNWEWKIKPERKEGEE